VKKLKSKTKILREKTQVKKLITICSVLAVVLFVSATQATMIKVDGVDYNEIHDGYYVGEILITPTGLPGFPDGVQIKTFCVETLEHIWIGDTYNAVINTVAIHGSETTNDPLDPETAWLFNQYRTGAIVIDTDAKAADFQIAIWILENEALGTTLSTPEAQAYVTLANASDWTDIHGVRVLNMGSDPDYIYQDLLVPEPATVCLLGFGALSLIRRKRT
jgi:hypothetical protein